MLKHVDRGMAVILGLGAAVGHSLGSVSAYAAQPMTLLWALNASALGALLAVLHLLRSFRGRDRPLAAAAGIGSLFWMVSSLCFGLLIGNPFDPRIVMFIVISAGLIAFSVRSFVEG